MASKVQWEKMNQLLLQCGSVHEARSFCVNAIEQTQTLVPFDQGRVYFFNDNAEIYDEFLIGVDKRITKAYHEHYSKVEDGRYSAVKLTWQNHRKYPEVTDWFGQPRRDAFFTEYLRPQGIRYSTGFHLDDLWGTPKVLFCIDRTSNIVFSPSEVDALYYLSTHLDNFYRNFYAHPPEARGNVSTCLAEDHRLTRREDEVAALLSDGVAPENIAKKLYISKNTVYKHISNIHSKLNVSTRQELLVKLLRFKD